MRILAINNNIGNYNNIRQQNTKPSKVSFMGQRYDFGYFTDDEIRDTYKYLKYNDNEWRRIAKSDFESQLSLFQLVFGTRSKEIENHLNEMERLRKGLKEQERKLAEQKAELEEAERVAKIKSESIQKKNLLNNEFFTLIDNEKNGQEVVIPNGILIEIENYDVNKEVLKWLEENDKIVYKNLPCFIEDPETRQENEAKYKSNFEVAKKSFDIFKMGIAYICLALEDYAHYNKLISQNPEKRLEAREEFIDILDSNLEAAQKTYNETGKRTLIYLDNFGLIGYGDKIDNKQIIAFLKSIFCSCADKYKTTFLLNLSKNKINNIDSILLADSRFPLKVKI